jgi:hypothetical protein
MAFLYIKVPFARKLLFSISFFPFELIQINFTLEMKNLPVPKQISVTFKLIVMKKLIKLFAFGLALIATANIGFCQWQTSGNNIYNTNLGNVGIGTPTPTGKLDIHGTLQLDNQLTQNYAALNYNYSAKFFGIILQSPQQDNFILEENALYDGQFSENSRYIFNGPAAAIQMTQGRMFFYIGAAGTAGNVIPNWSFLPKIGIANNGGMAIGSAYAVSSTNSDGILTVSNRVGVGTNAPTDQLHTTGSVRFQGLTSGTITDLVGIDASGKLWRTSVPSSGLQSTCATINMIPKITGSNQVGCSIIYDNGTSVGIGTTGGFGYTSGATLSNGSPTPPSTFTLSVNGWTSSTAFVALSDRRYKKDIQRIKGALDKVIKLEGVSYYWNKQTPPNRKLNDNKEIGFIAQDVENIIPEAVIKTEDNVYGLNYNAIIPVLAEAIKEFNDKITTLKEQSEELKKENLELKETINTIYKMHLKTRDLSNTSFESPKNKLFPNIPNPSLSMSDAKIEYFWETGQNAVITFNSIDGKTIKSFPLKNKGQGGVLLNTNRLVAGTYTYSFYIDGRLIDSKLMILSR